MPPENPKKLQGAQNIPGGSSPTMGVRTAPPCPSLIPLGLLPDPWHPAAPRGGWGHSRAGAQSPKPSVPSLPPGVFSPCPDPGFRILFSQLCRPRAPVWEAGKCCHTEAVSAPTATLPGVWDNTRHLQALGPKAPRVCQHCQNPPFPQGMVGGCS